MDQFLWCELMAIGAIDNAAARHLPMTLTGDVRFTPPAVLSG
jgi:hypothetical protein